jgi:iron complex transport system permease protein
LLGEDYARTMGLNITLTRIMVFASTSLLAGTVTAFCGPIGFIGIAIPHIARLLFKTANHFVLVPATVLLGISILLISDIVSQLPGNSAVLPINSITALLGIPIIIWIVFRNKKLSSLI